jgi:hypothetical protein
MRYVSLSVLVCLVFTVYVHGEVISLWNFNDAISGTTGGAQEFGVDYGNGTMTSTFNPSNIMNAAGSSINRQGDDPAGQALRLSGYANNGKTLAWMVSTAGFNGIDVGFAMQRTSTGFKENQFQYSVDSGSTWNPDAGFRIIFGGATSSSGSNRMDNLVLSGNPIVPPVSTAVPEPSTIGLLLTGLAAIFFVRPK